MVEVWIPKSCISLRFCLLRNGSGEPVLQAGDLQMLHSQPRRRLSTAKLQGQVLPGAALPGVWRPAVSGGSHIRISVGGILIAALVGSLPLPVDTERGCGGSWR